MSLKCPTCGASLSLNLAPNLPQLEASNLPQVASSNGFGEVRTSPKRPRFQYPDPSFHLFWKAYPRKVGKASSYSKWLKAVLEVEPQTLVEAARKFASKSIGVETRFLPYPEKWLNAGRWQDEEDPSREPEPFGETDWEARRAEEDARIAALLAEEANV